MGDHVHSWAEESRLSEPGAFWRCVECGELTYVDPHPVRMHHLEAVAKLDGIAPDDPERAHGEADEILLASVDPSVRLRGVDRPMPVVGLSMTPTRDRVIGLVEFDPDDGCWTTTVKVDGEYFGWAFGSPRKECADKRMRRDVLRAKRHVRVHMQAWRVVPRRRRSNRPN